MGAKLVNCVKHLFGRKVDVLVLAPKLVPDVVVVGGGFSGGWELEFIGGGDGGGGDIGGEAELFFFHFPLFLEISFLLLLAPVSG